MNGIREAGSQAFKVLDASAQTDFDAWLGLWAAWPEREVHAHPAYVRLFTDDSSSARCATFELSGRTVLFPFLLRSISSDLFDQASLTGLRDIITPYGYGGAVWWGDSSEDISDEFWRCFDDWSRGQRVVSEFVRFSLRDRNLVTYPGTVEAKQDNVVRDLDLSADGLWMDFDHKVRKNVKKAERSGVDIVVDLLGTYFGDFYRIYSATLDRRDANDAYYFPKSFFDSIHADLPGQFAYFHAMSDGRIVSTELVLISVDTVYSFLGGTDSSAFDLRPNDLLKYRIMQWAMEQGKLHFVLGGGYTAGDGIFRYKLAFAPQGARQFRVGSRVVEKMLYGKLVEAAESQHDVSSGFFPAYRG